VLSYSGDSTERADPFGKKLGRLFPRSKRVAGDESLARKSHEFRGNDCPGKRDEKTTCPGFGGGVERERVDATLKGLHVLCFEGAQQSLSPLNLGVHFQKSRAPRARRASPAQRVGIRAKTTLVVSGVSSES